MCISPVSDKRAGVEPVVLMPVLFLLGQSTFPFLKLFFLNMSNFCFPRLQKSYS